ncbi:MAG: Lipopolysaccharide heptosyltransferase [Nitrospira sp.]|nr:Lipopolysaccharide heptosyltransferase [Nitrospira sp.]
MSEAHAQPFSPRLEAWRQARRILCVRLDQLGDVIMTSPALRAVKDSMPGRTITLLTSPGGAEAARLMPFVDDILVYEAPWMKGCAFRDNASADRQFIDQLRASAFDAAILFTVYSQSSLPAALMCYLADIPLRLAHCRENPYQMLTDWVREPEPDAAIRHEVRRQLDLVSVMGAHSLDQHLSMTIPLPSRELIGHLLRRLLGAVERPWVVIHPGASAASRRYPPESFAMVARQLIQDFGWTVIFTGTQPERRLIETIREQTAAPTHSLAGELDLGSLAALLERAPLVISNNTGTVHVAAAVGTPVVDLYALTNPQHMPWLVPHRVLFHDVPCKFCYKSICPEGHQDCLRLVTPETVVNAATELLAVQPLANRQGERHLVYARD